MMKVVPALTFLVLSQCCHAWEDVSTPEYLALPAAEKKQIIWDNCLEDTSSAPWFSVPEMVGLFTEDMCPVMRTVGDMLPWEFGIFEDGWRNKYIHTVGAVGQVEWKNLGGHSFTGLFEGASHGIVRFSLAKEPDTSALNTAPGLGLKILRDGMDSASLVAMYSVDGQESWNFFKNDFSNHVPPGSPLLVPLEIKFSEATKYVSEVGLSDWSFYGEDGEAVANPVFPYKLRFHPTGDISFSDTYVRPVNEDLMTIPSGSTLYQVFAWDQPEQLGGTEAHIADLVLTSEMTTSLWGDQHLYFRHQDMWDDIDIIPEWADYTDTFGLGLSRCPFNK